MLTPRVRRNNHAPFHVAAHTVTICLITVINSVVTATFTRRFVQLPQITGRHDCLTESSHNTKPPITHLHKITSARHAESLEMNGSPRCAGSSASIELRFSSVPCYCLPSMLPILFPSLFRHLSFLLSIYPLISSPASSY